MKHFIFLIFTLISFSRIEAQGKDDSASIFQHIDKIKTLVEIWNKSINNKQPEKLAPIYADTVQYYVKKTSPKECVASKEKWLKANPGYKQELKHLIIYLQEDVQYVLTAEFDKIYTDKGTKTVTALLDFKLINNEWKITKETDMPSEVNLVKSIKSKTLPKGTFTFWREYWMDSRNTGLAHDMVPYKFSLELKIGDKIGGVYSRYSGFLRSWTDHKITSGKIENGILEISCSYMGSPAQKMHFKIIDSKKLMCIDKGEELYGKVMMQ